MKMKFNEDKFYNGELIYKAHQVYDISEDAGWADRWIRRGGVVVKEEVMAKDKEVIQNTPEETEIPKTQGLRGPKKKKPSEEIL